MKVCLLNESFPPVIDGVVNVMMNYADYMMRDYGAEIEVGTPEYPDGKYDDYPYEVVAYPSFDTAAQTNGYRTGNPLVGKAVSKLAEFKPDIIHAHGPASALVVARLVREMTGAPIVFTYHTKYDIDIRRAAKINLIAEETIKAMVGNIEACDEVWTVSDGAGKSLKALGFQGDYRVMNNGVDFAKGRVDSETVKKVTAGYDLPEDVPMDALKILADSGQDFRMVFVGKGPDQLVLEHKAKELGLMGGSAPKVFFTGPIYDREALRAWNTRADLFLFPSTFDTNGLVVREAAACGLASVLIKDSCAAEGITDDHNGFIIEESAEAMAELLKRLCGDLDHVHDVGQHAMDEIYLSWEECVAKAYERYQYILARNKIGAMPHRKEQMTDNMVKIVAKAMEEENKVRKNVREGLTDMRSKALTMMEYTKAGIKALDTQKLRWEDIAEDLWTETEELFKK